MVDPSLPPSSRVQLEVAFLDANTEVPEATAPAPLGEQACLTVLVIAAEADVRRYVRECIRELAHVRLVEASTVAAAIALATDHTPALLIVDEPESAALSALSGPPAIVIVDDVPHRTLVSGERLRLLGRPFTADGLVAEVARLL